MAESYIITGGGIAGLTAAHALLQKGFDVQVYERSPQLREEGAGLGISANAMMAMREIGLEDALLSKGKTVSSIDILSSNGRFLTKASPGQMNTAFPTESITIHRMALLKSLAEKLPSGVVQTGKQAVKATQTASGVRVTFADGSEATGQAMIAADGIGSVIRKQLEPTIKPRFAGYTAWRGVLKDPLQLDKILEMWGPNGRVGIVPLNGGYIYWFVCINARENDPRMKEFTSEELSKQFESYKGPAAELIRNTAPEDLLWTDIYDLPPLSHYAFGRIVLIGDAAHATTPNLGQGAGQAMEDAVILAHFLAKEPSIIAALKSFEKVRIKRTQRVTRISRRIGTAAQLSSPAICGMRNMVMRVAPQILIENQLKFLFEADLTP